MITTINTKIVSLQQLPDSPRGNPRWQVQTEEALFNTKPDTAVGRTIGDLLGRQVTLEVDPRHSLITKVTPRDEG